MPATYEPIASTTLPSATASYTFSSVPNTFTDLIIVASYANSTASYGIGVRFNGDTTTNYSNTLIYTNGTVAGSTRSSSYAFLFPTAYGVTNSTTIATPATAIITIMSYANTNINKTILYSGAGSGSSNGVDRSVGLWRSTSAITSITLFGSPSGSLVSGTKLSLYGIKAA